MVYWSENEEGVEVGTCNCGVSSNVYTELVKHLKNLLIEDPKKPEVKPVRVRREHLHDRPLQNNPRLQELRDSLEEGPSWTNGKKKPSRGKA